MFEQCFNQLDDEDKARLQPVNGTIAGFINETIQPIGYVSFSVTLTDGKHTRTEVLDFLVISSTSHHDVLLGQDAIASFNMSVSTPHGALGFPTETGVAIVYKNRECHNTEGPRPTKALKPTASTEPEKWVLNSKFPEQTITFGASHL